MKTTISALFLSMIVSTATLFGQSATAPLAAAPESNSGFIPFPRELSYQGLLTTPAGTPAADGSYNLRFDLFNVFAGGTSHWTETQNGVQVDNGVFNIRLGSVTPLPASFTQIQYLEVAALAGPGIGATVTFSPRTQLAASPFSLAPWQTAGYDVSYPYGSVAIGTATPDLQSKLTVGGQQSRAGIFTTDSVSFLTHVVHAEATGLGSGDVRAVYGESVPADFWGFGGEFIGGYVGARGMVLPTGGSFYYGLSGIASGGTGVNTGVYAEAGGGGTNYSIRGVAGDSALNYAGYFQGRFRVVSSSGDSGVMLPTGSVSASELMNESGLAAHGGYGSVSIPAATNAVTDSVTITIPSDGYIVVDGGGVVYHPAHVNGVNSITWVNIDTIPGIIPDFRAYQLGYTPSVAPSGIYYYNFHCHRVYQLTAGTHTFYLNARNNIGANAQQVNYKWMQAAYIPTSYGPVTGISPLFAPGTASSNRLTGLEVADPPVNGFTEVDLRTLELTALRARAQAEEAEKILLEAQLAKQRDKFSGRDR